MNKQQFLTDFTGNGEQARKALDEVIREAIKDYKDEMYLNMQYYMEYCQMKGYITPQEWIEKHKHY